MLRNDVQGLADTVEALENEIAALSTMDPYDPLIPQLKERLQHAVRDLYRNAPRGV